ncbi:serine/threonine-protein kinase [Nakamurella flava]|nr:serine/threonine-protein kinase [Nakamurella flava]
MPPTETPPDRGSVARPAPGAPAASPQDTQPAVMESLLSRSGARPPAATRTPDASASGRRLAGRYRLDSVIGKGSMGTVWAATDEVLQRRVAIKEIDYPPGMSSDEVRQLQQRTLREARAIGALSNPYVVTLFDILTLDSGPVIVMELLRARSLADIIKQVERLSDGQAATIGVAVAGGLLAAHAAGITHRDVKPANVLICDDGRIKLTDFGIARSSGEQTLTATGLLLGSPAYIAPEVASGVPAGPVSDAWGLGGLLFACVEGHPPFDQGSAIATLTSVVKDPVPPHPHAGRIGGVVSGLLVKTPHLRMRLDRALTALRAVADDPSGMKLGLAGQLPPSPAATPAHGMPHQARPARPASSPLATPASGLRPAGPEPVSSPADVSATGRATRSGVGPGAQTPVPAASKDLPPPPWATDGTGSAALPALPDVAPPRSRARLLVALLVAALIAVAAFLGVRLIADAASDGTASAAAPPAATAGPADTGETPGQL